MILAGFGRVGRRIGEILARGHNADQCRMLRQLGAALAVSANLEASLELAREALTFDGGDIGSTETLLRRFRREHYANVARGASDDAPDETRS